jgi:hypothetical protein
VEQIIGEREGANGACDVVSHLLAENLCRPVKEAFRVMPVAFEENWLAQRLAQE